MGSMKEEKTCPVCGKKYSDYPALSRRDNFTKICPQCGINEAMDDFFGIFEKKGEGDGRGDV